MLLHIATQADWDRARSRGYYDMSTLGVRIDQEGFMHCSRDAEQAKRVAKQFYANVESPLLLLSIDDGLLHARGYDVRLEPGNPADPRSELFPHIYGGNLPIDAIIRAVPFRVTK